MLKIKEKGLSHSISYERQLASKIDANICCDDYPDSETENEERKNESGEKDE